jgi:uncharacterized protein DUF993
MDVAVAVINANAAKVDGVKVSLLDAQREINMRRRLGKNIKMYTGDDFNYAELIAGDAQGFSHALLGIFDAIAPAASYALSRLAAGDEAGFHDVPGPTVAQHHAPAEAVAPLPEAARPPACRVEPIEQTRYLFVDGFQLVRIEKGERPAERAVFRKQHGVAKAKLSVLASCPAEFRVGLWAGGLYTAWVRWSSDAPPGTPDQENSTLGFAVKLFGVPGRTLATDDPLATNADLVFQNSDIFLRRQYSGNMCDL